MEPQVSGPRPPPDDDLVNMGDASRLRSVIREELGEGLRGFRSELEGALRHILRQEILPNGQVDHSALSGVRAPLFGFMESTPKEPEDSPTRLRVTAGDVCPPLPGTVEDNENNEERRPSKGNGQGAGATRRCDCGNPLLDDTIFCRKCGVRQANACSCGNILKDDAEFCRKCGKAPPNAGKAPTLKTSKTADWDGVNKEKCTKKKKKETCQLFKEEDEAETSLLQRVTTSRFYEAFSGILISVNALYLGYQTQYLAVTMHFNAFNGKAFSEDPASFAVIGYIFCFLFTIELGLRWVAEGFVDFFKSADKSWNALDVLVVGTSLIEVLLDIIAAASSTEKSDALGNVSVLRVLRVVRIVRVARVIRVMKFFRELRMMIFAILGCVKNLVWVMVVLMMTFFMFAVLFTSAAIEFLDAPEKWTATANEGLVVYFGSIDTAILSLFMSMSGGNDWAEYYSALLLLPAYYRLAFLVFIAFCLFAVVNIVTGVFVESALQANIKDKDIVVSEELRAKKEYLKSMQEIFEEMDACGDGTISMHEFNEKLKDERVIAYFNVLKLDVSDAKVLFHLIDNDNSEEIGIDEFLEGCYKLQGESRSLDMKIMQSEVHFLQEHFWKFEGDMSNNLERILDVGRANDHAIARLSQDIKSGLQAQVLESQVEDV